MFNFVALSTGCSKGLLMVLNALCMLVALATLGFAVFDTRILKQYGDEQATGTLIGDITIIVATLLLIVIATFGCVGAVKENVKILYLYVGFLMILVVLELLIAIFVSVQRYGLEFRIKAALREDFFRNASTSEEELTLHNKNWDNLQNKYRCCGLEGPEDYLTIQRQISVSCCSRAYNADTADAQDLLYKACLKYKNYYSWGCEDQVLEVLRDDADYLFSVAMISCCFEAGGMLLAMWLANTLKNSVKVYKHTVKY